ncbi:MAG TPA: FAD-dependent oxidoreductase, partial [Polyangiaceae bacterium]|nr:FAD-dependent oxidoreductase [Polyangiaceae bacterium]
HRQRAGEVLEITIAGLVGIFRSGALFDERGFDVLDDLDFIDWLRQNGLSDHAAASPFLHGLYSLMFAYEGGDCRRPRVAAGQALRGCMRMFLTYRGAFFWKMQAGMGDIVFAPLYELLKRRGVRFELFHRLTAVGLSDPSASSPHVARLDFDVQALVRDGREYAPLVDVHGLPCWPRSPDFEQLVDGERLRERGRDFDNSWDTGHEATRSLEVGRDFDLVVLAVGGGAVAGVCAEILERDERWRRMSEALATVATQALQLWLRPPMSELGWARGEVTMTGFVSPFDTWADMTHLVPAEAWPACRRPGAVAYFCNVLDERDVERCGPVDARHPLRVRALVRGHAQRFLSNELGRLWPRFVGAATATRELFVDGRGDTPLDASGDPLDGQYFVGNVDPSDRYVQTLPGTTRYRISPLDRTFDNLTIAGDWTDCGLSVGCVESAVMSGLLAAHAISGLPRLDSIVGYDHP